MARHTTKHDSSETSPLLPPNRSSRSQCPDLSTPKTSSWQTSPWQTPERLTLLLMLAILLFSLGDQWMNSPQTRIAEAVICYRYYERVDPSKILVGRQAVGPGAIGGVAEMWCKADAVQSELASLRGWQKFFDGLPSLVMAVPLGWAADRFGRKPIILLGIAGFILQASWIQLVTWFWQGFDVRWIWLGALFMLPGGGSAVLSSTIFVVLSDLNPESRRAAVFLRVGAFNLLADLLMPPFAALLMEISPWIPNLGGTALEILVACLFPFIPETLNYQHPSLPQKFNPQREEEEILPPPTLSFDDPDETRLSLTRKRILAAFRRTTSSLTFLTADWRILALILPFLSHLINMTITQLLLQYISARYGIKISRAILLSTIRIGVLVFLLFAILPYLSSLMTTHFRLSPQRRDLYLLRLSFILIAAGWILVGLSPNLPLVVISLIINALGSGTWLVLRSFLTSLVPKDYIARVYSIVSIVDTLGVVIGSPVCAGLFSRGLALGGAWIGLPFYFLGLAGAAFSVLMFAIGLRKGEDESVGSGSACDDEEVTGTDVR